MNLFSGGTAFARHGIDHLSVSSIGTFSAEPALWVAERLLKREAPVGAAAHRGTAAEKGICMGLLDPSIPIEDCQAFAVQTFNDLTVLSDDPRCDRERNALPGFVLNGLNKLRPRGVPSAVQKRVDVMLPGVPVPWEGWIDLYYGSYRTTVDIKTTHRLPAEPTTAHARQLSLYTFGTNIAGRVAYFTPAKSADYLVEDRERHIKDLVNIANRMERFLGISDDPEFLASIVVPNVDSFYYADAETRKMCREVFGL
jgi:hypothetical protein